MYRSYLLFALLAGGVLLLDQLSKTLIFHWLFLGQSVPVLGDFFKITYILNPGGAFGTKLGGSSFYLFVSIAAIAFTVIFFLKTLPQHFLIRIGLALVLGGALGNLTDRFRFGQVIDFLDFDIPDISISTINLSFIQLNGFTLERWPIFNLADSAITIGAVLIVIHILKHKEQKPPRLEPSKTTPQN
ncbi:MAG: signal peptidase II [candidate division Zixibacteria bacterium RBG_16_50_21]|nr:MAG: signal peptidase II [candidate division Zixibacteria bacterium RBG_16_50_21]